MYFAIFYSILSCASRTARGMLIDFVAHTEYEARKWDLEAEASEVEHGQRSADIKHMT